MKPMAAAAAAAGGWRLFRATAAAAKTRRAAWHQRRCGRWVARCAQRVLARKPTASLCRYAASCSPQAAAAPRLSSYIARTPPCAGALLKRPARAPPQRRGQRQRRGRRRRPRRRRRVRERHELLAGCAARSNGRRCHCCGSCRRCGLLCRASCSEAGAAAAGQAERAEAAPRAAVQISVAAQLPHVGLSWREREASEERRGGRSVVSRNRSRGGTQGSSSGGSGGSMSGSRSSAAAHPAQGRRSPRRGSTPAASPRPRRRCWSRSGGRW